jgi:hypothetical protein
VRPHSPQARRPRKDTGPKAEKRHRPEGRERPQARRYKSQESERQEGKKACRRKVRRPQCVEKPTIEGDPVLSSREETHGHQSRESNVGRQINSLPRRTEANTRPRNQNETGTLHWAVRRRKQPETAMKPHFICKTRQK